MQEEEYADETIILSGSEEENGTLPCAREE